MACYSDAVRLYDQSCSDDSHIIHTVCISQLPIYAKTPSMDLTFLLASRLKPSLRTIDGLGWLMTASHAYRYKREN